MKVFLIFLPTLASSFLVSPQRMSHGRISSFLASDPSGSEDENEGNLVLDGLDSEMRKMSSKYSFTESDFLAAARKRAEQKPESNNAGASDEEWKRIADEKKAQVGEIDDWENSAKEAGNADSQILLFTEPPTEGEGEDGEGGEPKLLLF